MARSTPGRPRRLRRWRSRWLAASVLAGCCVLSLALPSRVEPSPPPLVVDEDDTVLVPTPIRPIAKGEKVKDVELVHTRWPKSPLTANYLQDLDSYREAVVLTQLPAHLPIPKSALGHRPHDMNAVIEKIPEGMRAITVRVDIESAVEGWARSGSYVDVIVLRQAKNRGSGIEAKVIAQNVKILSAGRSTEPLTGETVPGAPGTVTLLVSQQDALRVKTAESVGRLTFSLRGAGDDAPTLATAMDQRALLGSRAPSAKPKPILGTAKGPDGKQYVLQEDARWIRSLDTAASAGGEDGSARR